MGWNRERAIGGTRQEEHVERASEAGALLRGQRNRQRMRHASSTSGVERPTTSCRKYSTSVPAGVAGAWPLAPAAGPELWKGEAEGEFVKVHRITNSCTCS